MYIHIYICIYIYIYIYVPMKQARQMKASLRFVTNHRLHKLKEPIWIAARMLKRI